MIRRADATLHSMIPPQQVDAGSANALFRSIWRGRWYVCSAMLACTGLGAIYLALAAPIYQVRARVVVMKQGLPLAAETRDLLADRAFLATQAEVVRSPAIVEMAVKKHRLASPAGPDTDATLAILSQLKVTPVLGTDVLGITFRGPDAEGAAQIVAAIIASYRDYVLGIEHSSHLDTLRLLTQTEKELRQELHQLEGDYQQLRQQSGLMGQGGDASNLHASLLTQLGEVLTQTRSRRVELENRLELATRGVKQLAGHGSASPVAVTSSAPAEAGWTLLTHYRSAPSLLPGTESSAPRADSGLAAAPSDQVMIQEELSRAKVRESELAAVFGPKHPEIRALRQQIAGWESALREQAEASPQWLEQELLTVRMQEQRLAELYDDEFQKAKSVDAFLLQEQLALNGIERLQTSYDSIHSQLAQWQLHSKALDGGDSGITIRVLEQPATPSAPVWPLPALLLGACAVVGLVGGAGVVSIMEHSTPQTVPAGSPASMPPPRPERGASLQAAAFIESVTMFDGHADFPSAATD